MKMPSRQRYQSPATAEGGGEREGGGGLGAELDAELDDTSDDTSDDTFDDTFDDTSRDGTTDMECEPFTDPCCSHSRNRRTLCSHS